MRSERGIEPPPTELVLHKTNNNKLQFLRKDKNMAYTKKERIFEPIIGEITPEKINANLRATIQKRCRASKMSIQDLAFECDIAQDTLRDYYYEKIKTCRLSSAIKIAKFFNTTIEEMTGVTAVNPEIDSVVRNMESMPQYMQHYVQWVTNQLIYMNEVKEPKAKMIPVHQGICQDGNFVMGKDLEPLDISGHEADVRAKVFMGINIPCEHFMPRYSPYDTLLIANDRRAEYNEVILAESHGYLWLLVRKEEVIINGVKEASFYSLRDHRFIKTESEMDNIIGYVAGIHTDKMKVDRWL